MTERTPSKGKEDTYFFVAQEMYVEKLMSVPDIAAELTDVSDTTLYKWVDKGDWKRKRREHQENNRDMKTMILAIAKDKVLQLSKKNPGDLDSGDFDTLIKANKLVMQNQDPANTLAAGLEFMSEFAEFIMRENRELGAACADTIDAFLEQKRSEVYV